MTTEKNESTATVATPKSEPEVAKVEITEKKEKPAEKEKVIETSRGSHHLYAPEDLIVIGIDTDDKSVEDHPLWDPRINLPLDAAKVANVKEFGVMEAVEVTKKDKKYPGKPVLVFGRQRTRWAREANKVLKKEGQAQLKIKVFLTDEDEKAQAGRMVAENEARTDDDMLAKARKAQRLISVHGYSEKDAAVAFGVDKSSLRVWLKLLQLTPEVQKAIEDKKLTPSAALPLYELPLDKQNEALKDALTKQSEPGSEGKKIKAKDVAEAAATVAKKSGGRADKATDKAQSKNAPNRSGIRRVIKAAQEMKPQWARQVGAVLAWVVGDRDTKNDELDALSDDMKDNLKSLFKMSDKPIKIKKRKAK